jgi:hypothetical protein
LEITIKSADGKPWGSLMAGEKIFSSGSIGFYGGGSWRTRIARNAIKSLSILCSSAANRNSPLCAT